MFKHQSVFLSLIWSPQEHTGKKCSFWFRQKHFEAFSQVVYPSAALLLNIWICSTSCQILSVNTCSNRSLCVDLLIQNVETRQYVMFLFLHWGSKWSQMSQTELYVLLLLFLCPQRFDSFTLFYFCAKISYTLAWFHIDSLILYT